MKLICFKSMKSSFVVLGATLLLAANISSGQDAWQALPGYTFGQSREPLATIEDQIRKSDAAGRSQIEQRLLQILQDPGTTVDSRRYICRWLGLVGSEKAVAPLAALLDHKDLCHAARIALEALPYASAGKALADALPKVRSKLLIGVVSSVGTRRVAEAVPQLSKLLAEGDASFTPAVLSALGQIGTEEANQVLSSAKVGPELQKDRNRARITAAWRLADSGKRPQAAAIFRELNIAANQPTEIRIAAAKGLMMTLPGGEATTLMVQCLEGEEDLMRLAAIEAFAAAGDAQDSIVARLPSMQPKGQLLLLGLVADLPEVAARKPVLQVLEQTTDPAVKAAVVECLAVHGETSDVAAIVKLAASAPEPVKSAARRTLQRMSRKGVDTALIAMVESTDSAARKAVLETIVSRRMSSALPALTRLLRGSDAVLASEAARTLGVMGGAAQLKDLTGVLVATRSNDVRGVAEEAVRSICSRSEDKVACAEVIERELANAATPEARAALLPATLYTGGAAALQQVLNAMADANAEVRTVAFRTLVSWPESRAATHLLRCAETNSNPTQAIVALRDGCLRLAELEEVPLAERASILKRVVEVARRPEEKRRAIALMSQVPSLEVLDGLIRLAEQTDFRAEATVSAVQIARSLAVMYPGQSTAALEKLNAAAGTPELQKAVQDAMKAIRNAGQSADGFILAWMQAGPYTQTDKDGSALFDIAFPPEKSDAGIDWRPVLAPKSGTIDLLKTMSGGDRVAYLRAVLTSETPQKARLELGSDDGVKVWLNGQVIHANNTVRPCSPGQDKVNVSLNQGENVLLLKITQGGGDWAAVARLVGPDGKPLSTVMVGASK